MFCIDATQALEPSRESYYEWLGKRETSADKANGRLCGREDYVEVIGVGFVELVRAVDEEYRAADD